MTGCSKHDTPNPECEACSYFRHWNECLIEAARLRAAIVAWAKRYQWGADAWKREPENAALFAIAEEVEK